MTAALGLPMLQVPVVGNTLGKGVESGDLGGIVRDRSAVGDNGGRRPYSFKTVPDIGRDGNKGVVVLSREDLLHLPAAARALPVVVEDELDDPAHDRVIEGHDLVQMPSLDHPRVDDGKIDLPELLEPRVIPPEHVHDLSALILNLLQRANRDSLYHVLLPAITGKSCPRPYRAAGGAIHPGWPLVQSWFKASRSR